VSEENKRKKGRFGVVARRCCRPKPRARKRVTREDGRKEEEKKINSKDGQNEVSRARERERERRQY